jgi:hypothetical protein
VPYDGASSLFDLVTAVRILPIINYLIDSLLSVCPAVYLKHSKQVCHCICALLLMATKFFSMKHSGAYFLRRASRKKSAINADSVTLPIKVMISKNLRQTRLLVEESPVWRIATEETRSCPIKAQAGKIAC